MKKKVASLVLAVLLLVVLSTETLAAYTNQVGRFKYYSNAVRLKNTLEAEGFKVYVSDGPLYVVTVERSSTYSEALQVKERLSKLNIQSFIKKISNGKAIPIEASDTIETINVFPLSTDSILRGVHGSQTLFFYVNENWIPDGNSYVDLRFSHSPVATAYESTLTIYVNDRPIHTIELTNEEMDDRTVRVPIPSDSIIQGFNALTVGLYKRMSDKPCADLFNTGNWFRLSKDTVIHLEYRETVDSTNLNDYPYPYFEVGRDNPVNSIIVLPDNFSHQHLTAAAYLAAGFGKYEPYKNISIKVANEQDVKKDAQNTNLIFIGDAREFQNIDELPAIIEEKDAGILEEFVSPWNSQKKLLRIAGEGNYMAEAARALFYNDLVRQMKTNRQAIRDIGSTLDRMNSLGDRITLADLGYSDIIVKGVYQQAATISYSLPAGVKLKEDAGIVLDLRYSQALEFIQSSVTVTVNDVPVGSKKLTFEGAEGERISFKFPPEILDEQVLNIVVRFFLDLGDIDCNQRYENQAWAVIRSSSYLYLPVEEEGIKTLKNYHSFFCNNGRLADTVVVISDEPTLEDIKRALNLFAYLGHFAKDLEDVELVKAKDFTGELKSKNVILIGTPNDNPCIRSINQHMFVKFDESYARLVPNKDFPFLEELGNECGVVQVLDSPWRQGKKVMVISGIDYSALKNAELMVTSVNIAPTLSGVVSMMDDTGDIYSFEAIETADATQGNEEDGFKFGKLWVAKLQELVGQRGIIILAVMLGLITSITIVLFYLIKKNYR